VKAAGRFRATRAAALTAAQGCPACLHNQKHRVTCHDCVAVPPDRLAGLPVKPGLMECLRRFNDLDL